MNIWHYVGCFLVLLLITLTGLWSGRQVRASGDFSGEGRSAGSGIVAGVIIGTLVGGSSTIGTAQLAFTYGFSAWWFTLGGGIGCLILALVYSRPLYNSGISTLPQLFRNEYGSRCATVSTMLMSLGSFLSIVSQLLSGMALVTSISTVSEPWAVLLSSGLMLIYVVFGGVWGAGRVGIVKTVLLYFGVGICGILAVNGLGGISTAYRLFPHEQFFNLFARGLPTDIGAGLSLIVGIVTTQTYIQAIVSAKSLKIGRKGALLSALLVPLIGIAGIFVGLYMRHYYSDIRSSTALPLFIMKNLPALPAGIVLATLLVTLVGTGAGLALGIGSMFCRDVYKVYVRPNADERHQLIFTRCVIIGILLLASLLSRGNVGSLIISWSFLSMGLRGAVAFFPLCTALFLPGRVTERWILAGMLLGPTITIISKFFITGIDPLFPGMAVSLMMIIGGLMEKRRKTELV